MMHCGRSTTRSRTRGFTLLEVLASTCVLLLIVGLAWQLVSMIMDTTSHRTKGMEATGTQRVALDTLSQDIYTLVRQHGATLCWKPGDAPASDELRFLCLSRPEPNRPRSRMTLVSYFIEGIPLPVAEGAPFPALIRGDAPVTWPTNDEDQPADFDFARVLRRPPLGKQPVAEGVFRFDVLWLCRDGVLRRIPPTESIDPTGFRRVKLEEVAALIVTLAGVDRSSLLEFSRQGALSEAQECLSTLTNEDLAAGHTTFDRWREEIGRITSPLIRRHVQLVQRTYYLPK
jgi:hypothetical protein